MSSKLIASGVCFLVSAAAQSDPAALIRVIRDTTNKVSSQPYVDGKIPVTVLGMQSISGPSESWLLEMHDSFGSIEDVDKALGAPLPGDSRTLIGAYRPGLSFRPEEALKAFPKARYLLASVYRLRFGGDVEFLELVRQRRARYDFINLNRPEIAYQVVSGMASGTYVFLTPLSSLKMLDDAVARTPLLPDGPGKKNAADVEISQEHMLLRIDPRMSNVPEQFGEADPDFWNARSR